MSWRRDLSRRGAQGKKRMRAIFLGALLAVSSPAVAAEGELLSARAILPGCKLALSSGYHHNSFLQGHCSGIVRGISNVSPSAICAPNGVTLEQRMRVVVDYTEARANRINEPFDVLAFEAMRAAWPCQPLESCQEQSERIARILTNQTTTEATRAWVLQQIP